MTPTIRATFSSSTIPKRDYAGAELLLQGIHQAAKGFPAHIRHSGGNYFDAFHFASLGDKFVGAALRGFLLNGVQLLFQFAAAFDQFLRRGFDFFRATFRPAAMERSESAAR